MKIVIFACSVPLQATSTLQINVVWTANRQISLKPLRMDVFALNLPKFGASNTDASHVQLEKYMFLELASLVLHQL